MDTRLPYWGSVFFSVFALVLLVVNVSLANANHSAQAEIQQRQAVIAAGDKFSQLNQGIVQALAEAAVKNNDTQARELLTSQGITVKANEPAPAKSDKK